MKKKEKKTSLIERTRERKGKRNNTHIFFVIFRSAHKMRQLKTQNGKLASLPNKGGNQTGKKEYVTDPKQKQEKKKEMKICLWYILLPFFPCNIGNSHKFCAFFLSLLSSSERKVFLLCTSFPFFYFFETASVVSSGRVVFHTRF